MSEQKHWYFGEVTFGTPRVTGPYELCVPLRSTVRPNGADVEDPQLMGRNVVDHRKGDQGLVGLKMVRWAGTDPKSVNPAILDDPGEMDKDARAFPICDCVLTVEKAVRKETKGGGQVVEYQLDLVVQLDSFDPMGNGVLGMVLSKAKTCISLHRRQLELEPAKAKTVRRRKGKIKTDVPEEQQSLPE